MTAAVLLTSCSRGSPVADDLLLEELLRGLALRAIPLQQALQAFGHRDPRLEAEQRAGARDVGNQTVDIPGARLVVLDDRIRPAGFNGHTAGEVGNRDVRSGADVDRLSHCGRMLAGEQDAVRGVADVGEVA
jgi:hypothetical protein